MLHSLYTKKRKSAALLVGKHKIVPGQVPYVDVVKQLPPNFPLQGSADPLIKLSEQAAHEFIRIREETDAQHLANKLSNELSSCIFRNHRYPLEKDGKPI